MKYKKKVFTLYILTVKCHIGKTSFSYNFLETLLFFNVSAIYICMCVLLRHWLLTWFQNHPIGVDQSKVIIVTKLSADTTY